MYIGHSRLCVSLSVCVSVCPSPHSHTTASIRMQLGVNGRSCSLVVHYWADLQSVYGFRCCATYAYVWSVRGQWCNENWYEWTSQLFGQLPVKFSKALCHAIWTTPFYVYRNPFLTALSQVQQKLARNEKS